MRNTFVLLVAAVLLSACGGSPKSNKDAESGVYHINYEECLANERTLRLSEIADTIEYLELKTPDDLIITFVINVIPVEDFILVHCRDGLFKFKRNGDFVTRVGRGGQGPGEHIRTYAVDVDRERKEIIHTDIEQVLFYDYDGNFLRSLKSDAHLRMAFSDSVIWGGNQEIHIMKDKLYAMSRDLDTLLTLPNPVYKERSLNEGVMSSVTKFQTEFYHYGDDLFYKGYLSNDTIFKLSGLAHAPYAVFDMGKYKLPHDYEAWYSFKDFEAHGSNYWGVYSVCENDENMFFASVRCSAIPGDREFRDEDYYKHFLYDKERREGYYIKDKILDDISGGPGFWPRWIFDGYYVTAVEWYDLSEEIKAGGYELSDAAKAQFATFDYGTNPVLIMCKMKE